MGFKSHAKALRPEGEYECICHNCHVTETQKGDPVIEFEFIIRTDVDQPCAGQHLFKKFYADSNMEWPEEKIGRYANSLGVEDGEDFELNDLNGRCCTVVTKHFERDDGTKGECIFFTKPSDADPPKPLDMDDLSDMNMDDCPFN